MSAPSAPRPHLLVRASAGSGKTYLLVRRLIGILADAESPDSLLAATFSRKAAGEFRSKLLSALADAVTDTAAARTLAQEIGHDDWSRDDFLNLLSSLVRDPDLLRLSTIDAFFLELVGLFRLELGLGTDVRMAPENADDYLTRDLLRTIFANSGEEVRQAIFHLIEEDRSSESVRSFQRVLEDWIAKAQSLLREAPLAEAWGALPDEVVLPPVSQEEWNQRLARFESALLSQKIPPESRAEIDSLLEALRGWDLSPTLPKEVEKWIKSGAVDREKLLAGKKYFRVNRKNVVLDGDTGAALSALSEIFHANVIHLAVRNTRGAYQFLRLYEEEYRKRRLQNGSIRFADLPHLLSTLETIEGSVLAYRLDTRLKHWLLDEFQDTSRSQWRVIHPLIDELFYDSENPRSFFCVGDQKQAIYGWRQGDSRLFDEIYERYRHFEPRPLEARSLAKTYRCAPAIVEFTNGLFGSPEAFPDAADPAVVDRWIQAWTPHESARTDVPGRVEVTVSLNATKRDQAVLHFLLENRPWEHGHTVALLCRKNSEANRFEALMRARGIPTVRDGALSLCNDFITGRLLKAVFQVLLHPGDTAALGFLQSNSAHVALKAFCGGEISPQALRKRWETTTTCSFLTAFEKSLESTGQIDDAERRCLRTVHALVQDVETSTEPALREIVRTLEHARLEDTGAEGSVQILTIHRSKGLEFDYVLLPDLDASSGGANFKEFWTH
ncbi:MAG: UvrD-helicase domain-containing protein, partial [Puniceicoccales bacterium]